MKLPEKYGTRSLLKRIAASGHKKEWPSITLSVHMYVNIYIYLHQCNLGECTNKQQTLFITK